MLARPPTTVMRRGMALAAGAKAASFRAHAAERLLLHMGKAAARAHREGNLEQSHELYSHLVHARRSSVGDQHPLTVSAIGALSNVSVDLGELDIAERLAREAADTSKAVLGAMHPDSLRQLCGLADVLTRQGKLDEAGAAARIAVDGYRAMLGNDHADTREAESRLGRVLAGQPHGQQLQAAPQR